jgi:hypothetical protein
MDGLGRLEQMPEETAATAAMAACPHPVMLGGHRKCLVHHQARNDRWLPARHRDLGLGHGALLRLSADEEQPLGYELTQGRDYSEQTAAQIDTDIQAILNTCHDEVKALLDREHDKLDALVETLLRDETVEHEGLERILGPRAGGEKVDQ